MSFGFKVLRWGYCRREEGKNANESGEVSNNKHCVVSYGWIIINGWLRVRKSKISKWLVFYVLFSSTKFPSNFEFGVLVREWRMNAHACAGEGQFKKTIYKKSLLSHTCRAGYCNVMFWDHYMHIMCLIVCGCFFINIFFRSTKKDEIRLNQH